MAGLELYAPRKLRHRRTWTAAAIVLAAVFMVAGQVITLAPAMLSGMITDTETWPALTYILFASFGLTAAMVIAWVVLFERRGMREIGFNARAGGRFLRGYGIGLAFLATVVGVIWALGGYEIEAGGAFQSGAVGAALLPIGLLLLGFIVQGSSEEIVFRGWLMQLIASRHGLWAGIIGNALLFGLAHGGNIAPSKELFLGLANVALFGLFISLYAVREGSLWGVCGWHAAWNWLLGLGFGLEVSGEVVRTTPLITDLTTNPATPWWITGAAFGPEASVITTGVLIIGCAALILRGRTQDHGVEVEADAAQA